MIRIINYSRIICLTFLKYKIMKTFKEISPNAAWEKVINENVVILDIRKPEHYLLEHPQTAINLTEYNYQELLNQYDYEDPILIICYHGINSRTMAQHLISLDFENIYSITGGFEAWKAQNSPIEIGCV